MIYISCVANNTLSLDPTIPLSRRVGTGGGGISRLIAARVLGELK